MDFILTQHAQMAMEAREIKPEWLRIALEGPDHRVPDPNDPSLERFFRAIPARKNRVLRVVVNTRVAPWRVVSVFFDRGMKGKS